MKKISILFGSALCLLAASCTKDATDTVVSKGKTSIEASIEITRTVLGDKDEASGKYDVYWCSGDKIVVDGVESEALADVPEKATTASFVVNEVLTAPYEVVYPASVYDEGKAVLPAVQSYAEGSFANGAAVLVGTGDKSGVALRNACGFVKVTVLPSETAGCPLAYVKFYGNAGEAVCGAFDIDYAAALLVAPAEVAEDAASVTMNLDVDAAIPAEGMSFFISVPAQTFANGFTVEIVDVKGHRMTQKSTKEQVVAAGNILSMPAVQFVPTETIVDTEIRTAADMVAFAETVKGGNMKGTYLLAGDIDMAGIADWEGIGTGDLQNGFNGTFDGRGFAIKNLKSAHPVFNFALANSVIKNVVIDSSCEFANAEANTDKMNVASLVGMGRGVVEECVNNASVTHSGTGSADVYVGGLVGRLYRTGRVSGCTNNGAVVSTGKSEGKVISVGGVIGTFDRTADTDTAEFYGNVNTGAVTNGADCKTLSVGGVAGRSAHITCKIIDCVNNGAVLSNSTAVNNEQVNRANYVGGISGQNTGSLSNCTNYGTVKSSSLYYETRMGGVAGTMFSNTTIEQCTNETTGTVVASCKRTNGADGKVIVNQEHCGGVIGQCEGHILNCTNKGDVNSSSSPLTVNVGGVCGYVRNSTTLVCNINEGAVTVEGGGRVVNVGGLYASFGKVQTVNDGVSTNKGAVIVRSMESIDSAYLRCGGIVGFAYPATVVSEIENTGGITVNLQAAFNYFAVGGIIGSAECGASDVVNSGKILINNATPVTNRKAKLFVGGITGWNAKGDGHIWDNCRNNGEIGMASGSNDAKILFSGFMGGIVGYSALPLEVKNCTNTKYLNWSAPNTSQDSYFTATGGIVGAVDGAVATISDCHVTANTRHYMYNRNVDMDYKKMCHGGGIVGCAVGADASNKVAIIGCSNTGSVENKRSSAAGIVGYAQYCTVSGCRFTGSVTGSGPHFAGGIAGVMKDSSITDCTVKSVGIYGHSSLSVDGVNCWTSAGIAGYMLGASTVSGCRAFATLIQAAGSNSTAAQHNGMGMIVGIASDDAVVADCGVGGTLNTGSTGNAANLLVTLSASDFENYVCGYGSAAVSGTYYWDGTEE